MRVCRNSTSFCDILFRSRLFGRIFNYIRQVLRIGRGLLRYFRLAAYRAPPQYDSFRSDLLYRQPVFYAYCEKQREKGNGGRLKAEILIMDLLKIIKQMKEAGVCFSSGLTNDTISKIEEIYEIRFPDSLKAFYSTALPISVGNTKFLVFAGKHFIYSSAYGRSVSMAKTGY